MRSDIDAAIERLEKSVEKCHSHASQRWDFDALEQARAALRAMLNPPISEAEVEAGAKALYRWVWSGELKLDNARPEFQTKYREKARVILEAARQARAVGS